MIRLAQASSFIAVTALALVAACSSNNTKTDAGAGPCSQNFSVGWTNYALCAAGTGGNLGAACPATTPPDTCVDTRPVAACCTWAQDPKQPLVRAPSSLHYYGQPAGQPTVDLSCTATPAAQGTPQTVTLTGYVKVFLGQDGDSSGVKVEIFNEGKDGALGTLIGTAQTTTSQSPQRTNDWLQQCPTGGCIERQFTYAGIPTETPLIIRTSDANNAQKWASLYDYNIYFANSVVSNGGVSYDTTAVGTTDLNTVASSAGGFTIAPDKGLLAGEVHDCGDVRLQGATVSTDYPPQGKIFYFGSDETYPLPDQQAISGTSDLGLFGALNYQTGVPIHISAVGLDPTTNTRSLIGAYTVQVYAGAVTALSLRGRRPYQHD